MPFAHCWLLIKQLGVPDRADASPTGLLGATGSKACGGLVGSSLRVCFSETALLVVHKIPLAHSKWTIYR